MRSVSVGPSTRYGVGTRRWRSSNQGLDENQLWRALSAAPHRAGSAASRSRLPGSALDQSRIAPPGGISEDFWADYATGWADRNLKWGERCAPSGQDGCGGVPASCWPLSRGSPCGGGGLGSGGRRVGRAKFRQLSGGPGLRVSSEVPPARSGVYELQISAAVLAMSWSFAISSFSVSAFPRIEVANPHCGLIARRSRSTCCAASRTRAFRTSARSS